MRDAMVRLHRRIVAGYPRAFRERFGVAMMQDFDDYARDGRGLLRPLLDTTGGMMTERMRSGRPLIIAALAMLFVLPFLVLNHIVVFRIDPVFSWIRPGEHTSAQEVVILWVALGLLVVGAVVALLPVLRARVRGWAMTPNLVVAALLLGVFVLLAVALGSDLACAPGDKLCD